jgi:hypothetical protein
MSGMTNSEYEDYKWRMRGERLRAEGRQFSGTVTEVRGSWLKIAGRDRWLIPSKFADRQNLSPVQVGSEVGIELDRAGYVRSIIVVPAREARNGR